MPQKGENIYNKEKTADEKDDILNLVLILAK